MKPGIEKSLPFTIMIVILACFTIIFGVLSILNNDNWLYRIIMQASLGIMMLLNGVNAIKHQKTKSTGFLLIGTSLFIIFVMILSIFVGFQKGKL